MRIVVHVQDIQEAFGEPIARLWTEHFPASEKRSWVWDVNSWLEVKQALGNELLSDFMEKSILPPVDLTGACLEDVDLSNMNLRGVRFQKVHLLNSCLDNSLFSGASLGGATLVGVSGKGAHFDGAYMASANCTDATFVKTNFTGATLKGASFRGATIEETTFIRADVRGTAFDKANIGLKTLFHGASREGDEPRIDGWISINKMLTRYSPQRGRSL